jgi:hypothetical protein
VAERTGARKRNADHRSTGIMTASRTNVRQNV